MLARNQPDMRQKSEKIMKTLKKTSILTSVGISLLTGTPLANAQIEEIIVTAQKREQSVLDVPITMDVISGDFLDRSNTTELDDLSRFLPNVVIQEQAVSLPSFNIRGITDDTASVSATPRISVYQDGFDISKKTVSSAALFDIERIEVLKGPQPTLFGVAAANGAISVHSKRPSEEFELNGRASLNSEEGVDIQAMINIPINDALSFRLATLIREQDGSVKNNACSSTSYNPSGKITDHNEVSKNCRGGDLNGVSVQAFRASLQAEGETVSAILRLASETNEQPGIAFKSGSIAPRNGDTSPFTDAELGYGSLLGIDRDLKSADLSITYQVNEDMELSFDTFYKDVKLSEAFDADGSALRIQDAYFDNDAELYGASMRMVFDLGESFTGFIGASHNRDKSILPYKILVDPYLRTVFDAKKAELAVLYPNISLDQNVKTSASQADIAAVRQQLVDALFNADGTPISNANYPDTIIRGPYVFESDLEITSLVAEGSYDISDSLSLTAGLRYIDETRYSKNFSAFEAEEDFSATLPRFSLNYGYSDELSFYFNYAEGRRSPVVDPNFGSTQITKAEHVDSYDIGLKFYADKLSFTAAIFAYTYTDFQQSFTDAETLQSNTVTVGDSDIYGFESTVNFAFDDSLSLGASLGLLNAEFSNNTESGNAFDYGGNKFRLAPEVSGSLSASKTIQLEGWTLDIQLLSSYQSEVFFESSNYPGLSQSAYWLTDTNIKLSPKQRKWQVEFYADNLFDEEYLIDAGNTGGGLGIPTFVRGNARTAGIRFYAQY